MSKRDARIDSRPGTYLLLLVPRRATTLRIGRAGRLDLRRGCYAYVGSARGPGGLLSRVSRHRQSAKRSRWHIDYLTKAARVKEVWFSYDTRHREHDWARAARNLPGAGIPMKGFGSSDCRCGAHLFFFSSPPSFDAFRRSVRRTVLRSKTIRRSAKSGGPLSLSGGRGF